MKKKRIFCSVRIQSDHLRPPSRLPLDPPVEHFIQRHPSNLQVVQLLGVCSQSVACTFSDPAFGTINRWERTLSLANASKYQDLSGEKCKVQLCSG